MFDLGTTKTVDILTPTIGSEVVFTITVTNNGNTIGTNIVLDELIPSGYNYVSSSVTSGVYSEFDNTWTFSSIRTR